MLETLPTTLSSLPDLFRQSTTRGNEIMSKKGYVYILASRKNGTLYIGVTSNLAQRLTEHEQNITPGFTSRYGVKTLVYYEIYNNISDAIAREKSLKKYKRQWKINLIEEDNPEWHELHPPLQ